MDSLIEKVQGQSSILHAIWVYTYRMSGKLLEMEVLCGYFMWFPLPGQHVLSFLFKAAALFEAWISGTLEAVKISEIKESS